MLMLHDRLIAAEERICNLSAELDRRAPEIPAIPKGISVDHATRGCFFRFLAKPGTWPAYSEMEAQEEVTKRLLTALMALYDSDTGYTSVTFCQSPLLEASSNDVAMSTAIHNMGHEAETIKLSEALLAVPKATLVEGIISSSVPTFSMAAASSALNETFSAIWMMPEKGRLKLGAKEGVVWNIIAGSMPSVKEVAIPDMWERIIQAARPWYLSSSGSCPPATVREGARSGDAETYVEDRIVLDKVDIKRFTMAAMLLNENISPRVPEVLVALQIADMN